MNNEDRYKYSVLETSEIGDKGMYRISYVGAFGEFFLFTYLPDKKIWHFCCHDIGLEDIEVDDESKESNSYQELKQITKEITIRQKQADIFDYEEKLRIQREEGQFAQHMQTKQQNIGV